MRVVIKAAAAARATRRRCTYVILCDRLTPASCANDDRSLVCATLARVNLVASSWMFNLVARLVTAGLATKLTRLQPRAYLSLMGLPSAKGHLYTVNQKASHYTADDNFGKCRLIFEILSHNEHVSTLPCKNWKCQFCQFQWHFLHVRAQNSLIRGRLVA